MAAHDLPTQTSEQNMLQAVLADRIWTVPNLLSFLRLLCVPVFLWLLFGRDDPTGAAVLLGGLGATDWIDGKIARRWNQVSELGKILDPAADRIMLIVAVFSIVAYGAVPVWFGLPVMIREPVMFVSVIVLAALGAKRIDVTWYGKAGTFGLMFAFPLFLLAAGTSSVADAAEVAAWVCGIPGILLSYYALALYIPMARRALAEARAEAAAAAP